MEWIDQHSNLIFYLLLAVSLMLSRIPLIGKYFRIVNTMIHEGGHVLMTLLLSGEVISVNLFADTSGTTVTKAKGKLSQALIAMAGYPTSSLMALLCLYLLSNGLAVYVLFALASIALILMVLSIRNAYGLIWSGTFSVISLLLIYYNNPVIIKLAATFFSLIIMADSVLSTLVLLAIAYRQPRKAGDASNMQKNTGLHPVIWSVIFLAFAMFVGWKCMNSYFPPIKGITL